MKTELVDSYGKDLTDSEDHFSVTDILLSEKPVLLTVKDLHEESFEDEEVLI